MRLFILLTIIFSTANALAAPYTCNLSAIPTDENEESYTLSGKVEIDKKQDKFVISANYTVSSEENENESDSGSVVDVATETILGPTTSPTLEEALEEEEMKLLAARFGDEKVTGLSIYVGEQFGEDGSGLMIYKMTGEKGSNHSIVFVGWLPAFCD